MYASEDEDDADLQAALELSMQDIAGSQKPSEQSNPAQIENTNDDDDVNSNSNNNDNNNNNNSSDTLLKLDPTIPSSSSSTIMTQPVLLAPLMSRQGNEIPRFFPLGFFSEAHEPSSSPPAGSLLASLGEVKAVLLVRTDLRMGTGKMCAQCGHAALGIYKEMVHTRNSSWRKILHSWELIGEAKIALKCPSEEVMLALELQARAQGLPTYIVYDAGRTQIAAGTATVCAIAGYKSVLDGITGHLKLL